MCVASFSQCLFDLPSLTSADPLSSIYRDLSIGPSVFARLILPLILANPLPPLSESAAGKGTIIFTGATASLRGAARFGVFATGKFGLKALGQSLAREFGPQGVHVGHVVVDGESNSSLDLTLKHERATDLLFVFRYQGRVVPGDDNVSFLSSRLSEEERKEDQTDLRTRCFCFGLFSIAETRTRFGGKVVPLSSSAG